METMIQKMSTMLIICMAGLLFLGCINLAANAQATADEEGAKMTVDISGYSPPDPDVVFAEQNKGAMSEGFSLYVELEKPVVASEQPIVLRLSVLNDTGETLNLAESGPENDYWLDVKNAKGERLCVIKDPSGYSWPTYEGFIVFSVAPGEKRVHEYPMNKRYDMSVPGEYHITASRGVLRLDGEGRAYVVSNTVVLIVTNDLQNVQAAASPSIPCKNRRVAESQDANARPRLVEVRPILERHGCSLLWDTDKRKATVMAGGVSATLEAGSDILVVGGKEIKMWSAAKLVNGHLQAPGDAVSQITARCTVPSS